MLEFLSIMKNRKRTERNKPSKGKGRSLRSANLNPKGFSRTLAVDFDGVIAEYDGWKGRGVLGMPRKDVLDALRQLNEEGWKIVVHTTRGSREIASYLSRHGIPHHEINCNSDYTTLGTKPVADVYWDDRALTYSGDARRDIVLIRGFRTYSGRE